MKMLFFGTGEIGVPSLQAISAGASHELVAVVTQPDRPAGRSLKLQPSPVKIAAQALGIPVLQPEKIRSPEILADLQSFGADLYIVAAYGRILPPALLATPPLGCINIHASLLPRHRGASPIHAAILAGDSHSGITIMWMDEGLDTGDILLQQECEIHPEETAGDLHDKLARLAPGVLAQALQTLADGHPPRRAQDSSRATHSPKISKSDGAIDWTLSAATLALRVRGLAPWPGTHCHLPHGETLKIHRATPELSDTDARPGTILKAQDSFLHIATGRGILAIHEVQVAGRKRMASSEFLRGYALRVGDSMGHSMGRLNPTVPLGVDPKIAKKGIGQ